MEIYFPPSVRNFVPKRFVFSAWVDHMCFGYDIVHAVRPKLLVELGTHNAFSYFTFCQSMLDHDVDGLCYAVDTWEGDQHIGDYDESVFDGVNSHNREHYHGFSYLLKERFEQAVHHFADESIDLVHVDGTHTEEAVTNDFNEWFPKVKPGGVMLFHDIASRREGFGVWRFWENLGSEYQTFAFAHGFGLGVLRKNGHPTTPNESQLLRLLFESSEEEQQQLREFYVHANRFHELRRKLGSAKFGIAHKQRAKLRERSAEQEAK